MISWYYGKALYMLTPEELTRLLHSDAELWKRAIKRGKYEKRAKR